MNVIKIKQGDTLEINCQRLDASEVAVDITGMTIEATVKRGSFSQSITTAITTAATGLFDLTQTTANTLLWPVSLNKDGYLKCDVKFSISGTVEHTDTFYFNVEESIT